MSSRNRLYLVFVLLLMAGSMVFAIPSISDLFIARAPRLALNRVVDLGRLDRNDKVDCQFQVGNSGNAALIIDGAMTDCTCISVYRKDQSESNGTIAGTSVAPGESVTLGVRFKVTGELNVPSHVAVILTTNSPDERETSLSFIYIATCKTFCVPTAADFGNILLGSTASMGIDVYSDGRAENLENEKVTCSPNDTLSLRYKSLLQPESRRAGSEIAKVGRIEITLKASQEAKSIDLTLPLLNDGKPLFELPVRAKYVPAFETMPSTIVLPRRSARGDIYDMNILCRSNADEPFSVRVKNKPAGVSVEVKRSEMSLFHDLTLKYEREHPLESTLSENIELTLKTAKGETDILVPLKVLSNRE
jgi:hypothetical protein